MSNPHGVFLLFCLWFIKSSTLPNLYYRIQCRRNVEVKLLRKLEKAGLKVTKLKLDRKYFEDCISLKVCPKFLQVNSPRIRAFENVWNIQKSVIQNQISALSQDLNHAQKVYSSLFNIVQAQISFLEKHALRHLLKRGFQKHANEVRATHYKKLMALWKSQRFRSPGCLLNLSKRKLSVVEEDALRCGLNHHALPVKVDVEEIKLQVERCIHSLHSTQIFNNTGTSSPDEKFKDDVTFYETNFINISKTICNSKINRSFHNTCKLLSNDKDIKVCKYDKGNGIVILDSTQYFNKLDDIVYDSSKFEIVPVDRNKKHPVIKREEHIARFLKSNLKVHMPENVYDKLVPSGSSPGKIYGMVKVHKKDYPLRPVVSMLNTPEYNLAKFLDDIIKPNIPKSFMVDSSINFLDELKLTQLTPSDHMVSFDVKSLFTNVPLYFTISIIAEHIYSDKSLSIPSFPKNTFIQLLKLATGGLFMYKDIFIQQKDGVSMGNPLGPTMANFFMAYLEKNYFK